MAEDPRQTLAELAARLASASREDRPGILRQMQPLFGDSRVPAPARIAAAAHSLKFVPDRLRPVRRLARSLTAGLSPSRALNRLRHLQNLVEVCAALDTYIDAREKRIKLACPRCQTRLPRVAMVKHLWHEHGLILDRGRARPYGRVIEELQEKHARTGDPVPLDRVAILAGRAGMRRWLAAEDLPAGEIAPLLAAAAGNNAGLCPGCYSTLPAALPPLPPPLTLAHGRLAGDGYAIEIGDGAWFQTLRVTTPYRATPAGRRSLAPRAIATLAAGVLPAIAIPIIRSVSHAAIVLILAAIVYVVVRIYTSSARKPGDRAMDAAWVGLAPRLAEREPAARFLARLCLASTGHGDPEARARHLATLLARAAARATESEVELQLLAAASVLQIEDGARYGRDEVAGIAALAAQGFSGDRPAEFAEYAVGCYLIQPRAAGDLARLRILLVAAAFDAGLVPADLLDICGGADHLRKTILIEPGYRLGLLHGLWRLREQKPWLAIAEADTVFDLARTAPPTARRLLARDPDAMLIHRPAGAVGNLVGPVIVGARGVCVADVLAADPEADVRLSADRRELVFGRHRIVTPDRLPEDFPDLVKAWLRFRADVLLPQIDPYLAPRDLSVVPRTIGPFCRRCRQCGTVSAIARGMVGRAVQA